MGVIPSAISIAAAIHLKSAQLQLHFNIPTMAIKTGHLEQLDTTEARAISGHSSCGCLATIQSTPPPPFPLLPLELATNENRNTLYPTTSLVCVRERRMKGRWRGGREKSTYAGNCCYNRNGACPDAGLRLTVGQSSPCSPYPSVARKAHSRLCHLAAVGSGSDGDDDGDGDGGIRRQIM